MNLYRNILSDALKTSWKNKYLWYFGLFATLLGGVGEFELIFGSTDSTYQDSVLPNFSEWASTGLFSGAGLKNMVDLATQNPLAFFILISLFLVIIILAVFLVWISVTSQTALVYNSAKIKLGKRHSFKNGLKVGMAKFWPVFGLNVGLKVVVSLLFALLTLPIVSSLGVKAGGGIFFLLFILFIPLSIIISFIVKYAIAYVVVRESSFVDSIKESWLLFKNNWLISIEMAFLLFFINFVSWILLIMFFLVLAVPIVFIVLVFSEALAYINYVVLVISAMFIYIVSIIVYGSFLASFQISAWTNLYIELIGKGGRSKLDRLFNK